MPIQPHPPRWQTLLAFAILYLVWGSTYLAIRVGVREVPPFLLAGMRFVAAGLVLVAWMRARGVRTPTARQWASAGVLGALFFVMDYGLLFWAERRVPSGLAAVMMATIPVFMALSEIFLLRTLRLTPRLAVALLLGLGGVAILVSRTLNLGATGWLGGAPVDRAGAAALIVAAIGWTIASALTVKLPLPASKVMSSGSQMLAGGILLTLTSAALGEFRGFHLQNVSREAWLALAYLIVAGSIVAFTAYLWLIAHQSQTKVSTYAYVNPVIAVLLGYALAGEPITARTLLGAAAILASVAIIVTTRAKKQSHSAPVRTPAEAPNA
jgi:drug/metabolite transporter (DMT)-like permease